MDLATTFAIGLLEILSKLPFLQACNANCSRPADARAPLTSRPATTSPASIAGSCGRGGSGGGGDRGGGGGGDSSGWRRAMVPRWTKAVFSRIYPADIDSDMLYVAASR